MSPVAFATLRPMKSSALFSTIEVPVHDTREAKIDVISAGVYGANRRTRGVKPVARKCGSNESVRLSAFAMAMILTCNDAPSSNRE